MKSTETKVSGPDKFVFRNWKKLAGGFVLSSAALVFGGLILVMSFLAASNPIGAVRPVEPTKAVMPEVTATPEAKPKVVYYLPYPGILPDNPLYKLKAARDKVSLVFTFNEEKKAHKELLFADKRINAAVFLVEGGKANLGVTTATKAEKYLEQAVSRATKMNKGGQDVKSLMMELQKAAAKHIEIVEGLISGGVSSDEKKSLETSLATTKMLLERLEQMLLEAK
jgi:hypothetical protein